MKSFEVSSVARFAGDERLRATHARLSTLELQEIPVALRRYSEIASVWGIADDALRQLHMSRRQMSEIFAVYDAVEEERAAFERFWKKIGRKIGGGEAITITEECFWALQMVHAEIAAHLLANGRPKKEPNQSPEPTRFARGSS